MTVVRQADQEEIVQLRRTLQDRSDKAMRVVTRGALLGAVPVLLLSCLFLAFGREPNSNERTISSTLENAAGVVVSGLQQRPLLLSNIDSDPLLLAAKVELAKLLNKDFDCGPASPSTYLASGASDIRFLRDSACIGGGPFVIEASSDGTSSCEYQSHAKPELWGKVIDAIGKVSSLTVREVRIAGHASVEPIVRD